jgi:spermidine synthase
MSWTELATCVFKDGELSLYVAEHGAFMIRANGLELMNSRYHRSEDVLGAMAGALARKGGRPRNPRILIGGLGLGYTLAAVVKMLDGTGRITAAEIAADVITWYEHYFEPALFAERPENLRLVQADVAALIREAGEASYDVIVLDVDNGPLPFAAAGNDYLYSTEGLGALASALAENGVLLVWSGFEAPDFAGRAEQVGFDVACERVPIPDRPDLFHYIYRLARRPAGRDKQRITRP